MHQSTFLYFPLKTDESRGPQFFFFFFFAKIQDYILGSVKISLKQQGFKNQIGSFLK